MSVRNQPWPWFAVLSRIGREKSATLFLGRLGYACYVPVTLLTRKWSDRVRNVETPLFPGYFFCRMNPHARLPVLTTPGVIQIVGVGKTPIPVDESEMAALQRLGNSSLSAVPWPYLEVGHVARLEEGPLKGLTGIVIKIKSEMKLVLSVTLLQRSVAVEIDRSWIADVKAPSRAPVGAHHARTAPTINWSSPR